MDPASPARFPPRAPAARSFACCLLALIALTRGEAAAAATGAAQEFCDTPSPECVTVGHWNFSFALGGGVRTNPLAGADNIPLIVIPHVSYYGKRFFLDDLDLGVTLFENDANAFNLVASPGYDRVYFYTTDLQNIFIAGLPTSSASAASGGAPAGPVAEYPVGTPGTTAQRVPETGQYAVRFPQRSRQWTYLAGPEWTFKYHEISGQFDFLHEITERNHGNQIRAALGLPLVQGHGALTANAGITWNSSAYVNYYYGESGIYSGGSALDPFVKLGYGVPLSSRCRFSAFIEYEHLARAIAASPIVAENHVVTIFAGFVF
jgi:outer membrane protein